VPCLIGEASFCLWLLLKGVGAENWQAAERMRAD
jgi:hypothetical protein